MKKPKGDLTISQFSKIYDSPCIQAILAEIWPKLSDKKSPEQQQNLL